MFSTNQLQSNSTSSFVYDDNGSTISRTKSGVTKTFDYNLENRLAVVKDNLGATLASYYYDPFGRRLYKEVAGSRTYFIYAEEGLAGEMDNTGAVTQTYSYTPQSTYGTSPLYTKTATEIAYYQLDHLGTPQQLVNKSGITVWKAKAKAFGETLIEANTLTNNLRFPGQYYDAETDQHYNYFRDYDPQTGRYIQSDPIGLEGGLNTYGYVGGNPLLGIDPFGLEQQKRLKYRIMKASFSGLSPDNLGAYSEYYVFVDEKCKTTSSTNPKDVNEFLKRLAGSAKRKIKFDGGDIMSGTPTLSTEFTIEEEYTFSAPKGDSSCDCSESLAGGKYENGLYGMGEVSRWINEKLGIESPYGNTPKPDFEYNK